MWAHLTKRNLLITTALVLGVLVLYPVFFGVAKKDIAATKKDIAADIATEPFEGRYMCWVCIERLPEFHHGAGVRVTGYFNGVWWVAPNPMDPDLVAEIHKQYNSGFHVEKRTKVISEREFRDKKNWNS